MAIGADLMDNDWIQFLAISLTMRNGVNPDYGLAISKTFLYAHNEKQREGDRWITAVFRIGVRRPLFYLRAGENDRLFEMQCMSMPRCG